MHLEEMEGEVAGTHEREREIEVEMKEGDEKTKTVEGTTGEDEERAEEC